MLNAKSVAMQIVAEYNPEWVETFFYSEESLVEDLTSIISSFDSVDEMIEADSAYFSIRQIGECGCQCCFKRDILRAYWVKMTNDEIIALDRKNR